jgi:eukaryotic-like serine/threonine-protein kinase
MNASGPGDPIAREETIFNAAVELRDTAKRAAYLDLACDGEPALRARLEKMLAADGDSFLETPRLAPSLAGASTLAIAASPVVEPVALSDRIDRYKLLQKIGEGGCGVVYMAEQEEPVRRRVALKVIKLGMDTKSVIARFEAERQALALMDHPNIAKVLDAGATEAGRPYFVMELVRGIKITDYCDQNSLSTRDRLHLFIQVCHAIQHAHQKGVIHRDIKPSNILVSLHDGVPVPVVIDFGIAKATEQRLTEKTLFTAFEQFIGTPAYTSPEQAEMSRLDIDTRSDIYSLGVLLYELLTGKTPFDSKELVAAGLDEMRRTIKEREPARPSTRLITLQGEELTTTAKRRGTEPPRLIHLVSGDLDWIVMKCLEKDRARRYETANGLAADVERHLNYQPVVARPPSVGYRLQKSFRRNRLMFTAAGLVALALVLGGVGSAWQAVVATKARRDEAAARLRADEAAQKAKASELAARQNLYAADMTLAYQACLENNRSLALDLLNRHRPGPGETDLRGWEWRYFWSLCRSDALYILGRHSNAQSGVFGVAISPDDRLLATSATIGEVKIWDLNSRRLIDTPEASDASCSVAFSPDSKTLAFPTRHQGVKLWDVEGHREIAHFPAEVAFEFSGPTVGFSPNGRQLAIGRADGAVVLWDLATHTAKLTLKGHSDAINFLVFSTDGQKLVTGSFDLTLRLWSLTNGQSIAQFTNHITRLQGGALSPDGKTVASGSWDRSIRIWDLAGDRQVAVLTNHTSWVSALAFSPDGSILASASADCSIKFWETQYWREVSTLKGSDDEVLGIAFSKDGKTLFSGTKSSRILAWDGKPRAAAAHVVRRPADAGTFWLVSPDGIPFCCHSNRTFNLWDPLTLRPLPEHRLPEFDLETNIVNRTLSPGGERMAFVTDQGSIYLWDVEKERQMACLAGWPGCGVKFSPDRKLLGAVAAGMGLRLWSLETLKEIATLPKSSSLQTSHLGFTTNGSAVALGNMDGTIEVWDLTRRERVANWKAHREVITVVCFMSPDGRTLVSSSQDSTARLWDVETQREVRSYGRARNAYWALAVSPDKQRIVTGTAGDALIKIFNSTTGQELATLKGVNDWVGPNHPQRFDSVFSLAFALPDGNTLLSASFEEVRLWRAPSWAEIDAIEKGQTQER